MFSSTQSLAARASRTPKNLGSQVLRSKDLTTKSLAPKDSGPKILGLTDLGLADLGSQDLGLTDLGSKDLAPRALGSTDLGSKDPGIYGQIWPLRIWALQGIDDAFSALERHFFDERLRKRCPAAVRGFPCPGSPQYLDHSPPSRQQSLSTVSLIPLIRTQDVTVTGWGL